MSDPTVKVLLKGPYLVEGKITLLDASGKRLRLGKKSRSAAAELPPTSRSAMEPTARSASTRRLPQFRAAPNRTFRSLTQESRLVAGGF